MSVLHDLLLAAAFPLCFCCVGGVIAELIDHHDANRAARDNEQRLDQLMGERE